MTIASLTESWLSPEVLMAGFSLALSIITFTKLGALQRHDLVLARRLELHSLLQEADKLLLEHPQLLKGYRSSEVFVDSDKLAPRERDFLEAFAVVYLNVCEAAYSIFSQTSRLDAGEMSPRTAWERVVVHFFEDCAAAEKCWQKYRATYYDEFQRFADKALEEARRKITNDLRSESNTILLAHNLPNPGDLPESGL